MKTTVKPFLQIGFWVLAVSAGLAVMVPFMLLWAIYVLPDFLPESFVAMVHSNASWLWTAFFLGLIPWAVLSRSERI
jgi:hypothetical protein